MPLLANWGSLSNEGRILYGAFCGDLLYEEQCLYSAVDDESPYFVARFDSENRLLWAKILDSGVGFYSQSDAGWALAVDDAQRVVFACTSRGDCKLTDFGAKTSQHICSNGVVAVCFDAMGTMVWNCDLGRGWASPTAMSLQGNRMTVTFFASRSFDCGCKIRRPRGLSLVTAEYVLPWADLGSK